MNKALKTKGSTVTGLAGLMMTLLFMVLVVFVSTPIIQSIGLSGNTDNSIGFLEGQGYIVLASGASSWNPSVSYALRPSLDYSRILGTSKPTKITRGVAQGFSFPVYAADQEELYFDCHVPGHYDEASNIMLHIHGWLDTANTDKNFNFLLEWEHISFTADVVPNTDNNVFTETNTGTASQYQTFNLMFPIDYDIDGTDVITDDDCLYFRLRRAAASVDEIAGEFVICHIGVVFQRITIGE